MPLLEIRDLTKHFRLSALSRVSLGVEPGELLDIIGPNGSGKTTLFNCVTGVFRPSGGQVRFKGDSAPARAARRADPGARAARLPGDLPDHRGAAPARPDDPLGRAERRQGLEISDYAYVLELGLNRFEGSGEAIRSDERIRRLYLGR